MTELQKKALNATFERLDGMADSDLLELIDSQEVLDDALLVDANTVDYKMENMPQQDVSFSFEEPLPKMTTRFDYSMEKGVFVANGNFSFNDFALSFAA